MSEQNPKQNIIRFPLSRRERRQRLLDSKDARIRTTALLRMLCGWALVLGTALFLIANYRIFTPTSLSTLGSYIAAGIRSHDGDITTINYECETFSDGVRCLNPVWRTRQCDALFLSRAGSMTTLRYSAWLTRSRGGEQHESCACVRPRRHQSRTGIACRRCCGAGAGIHHPENGSIGRSGRFLCSPPTSNVTVLPLPFTTPQERGFQIPRFGILYCIRRARRTAIRSAFAFRQKGVTPESHVLFFLASSGKQIRTPR